MNNISINISIANRPYKLTIRRDEEERMRKAALVIDNQMKVYANNFAYKDSQDLLAMAALEFSSSSLAFESEVAFRDNHLIDKLTEIDQLLNQYIGS